MNIKQTDNPEQNFYDKNGVKIKIGDRIKSNIDEHFLDGVIREHDGKLGLFFKHADYFIKLDTMLDAFFNSLEVINENK
jgi:hypothetical protein